MILFSDLPADPEPIDNRHPGANLEFEEEFAAKAARFEGRTAEIFHLKFGDGRTSAEIAELLDVTRATVYRHLKLIRDEIRGR